MHLLRTLLFFPSLTVLWLGIAFAQQTSKALTNADVVRMVQAGLSDDIVVSAIQANETQLDISADALLALKKAGASDKVIAAVLASHQNPKTAAASAPSTASATTSPPALPFGAQPQVSQQQMPAQAQAMLASIMAGMGGMGGMMGMSPSVPSSSQMPHVSLVGEQQKRDLPLSTAQIAQTKMKGMSGGSGSMMLQSLATQALTFAAIGAGPGALVAAPMMGMAGGMIPGMHRGAPSMTYVWALPGKHSATAATQPKFEITYADIVGIDPDDYEPALVKLVQTKDNWRLVGASKVKMNQMMMGYPQGAIAEQRLPVQVHKISSGNVQIEPGQPLSAGEYAVVLHPLHKKHKGSLGGGSEAQVFYSVWDFSVPGDPSSSPAKKK